MQSTSNEIPVTLTNQTVSEHFNTWFEQTVRQLPLWWTCIIWIFAPKQRKQNRLWYWCAVTLIDVAAPRFLESELDSTCNTPFHSWMEVPNRGCCCDVCRAWITLAPVVQQHAHTTEIHKDWHIRVGVDSLVVTVCTKIQEEDDRRVLAASCWGIAQLHLGVVRWCDSSVVKILLTSRNPKWN